jgi:hypothetical protein
MGWYDVLADGRGKLAFRLLIEGLPYEFVTDTDMERAVVTTTAGRVRGLLSESLVGGEQVHPGKAELEQDVVNVEIVDRFDGETPTTATQVLAFRPSVVTMLTADAVVAATSLSVASTVGLLAGDYVYIGTETMRVSTVVDLDTITVTRGIFGSTAQAHFIGNGDTRANPVVTNRPVFLEGRRASLFAYGDGDSPTGDGGALIWKGVLQADARLGGDGTTWQLQIAGLSALFEADIGGDITKPKGPRGIYYPASDPLVVRFAQGASATRDSASGTYVTRFISGFFETQEEFCAALNVELAAGVATAFTADASHAITAIPGEDGEHWYLEFLAGAVTPRWLHLQTSSSVDLVFRSDGPNYEIGSSVADGIPPVTASMRCTLRPLGRVELAPMGKGLVPRGSLFGRADGQHDYANAANAPDGRMYVDGSISTLPVPGSVRVEHAEYGSIGDVSGSLRYTSVDTTDRWIQGRYVIITSGQGPEFLQFTWTPTRLPILRFVATFASDGSLYDFIDNVTTNATAFSNDGSTPFILPTDIEDWSDAVAQATRGIRLATNRTFAGSEATSLLEMLTHEWRLIGVYPIVGSDGRIGVRALESFASTDTPSLYLTATNTLADGQDPSWERNADGQFNTRRTLTGWNPRDNEHKGAPIVVRDIGAYSLRKATREIEVAPRSFYAEGDESDPELVAEFVELSWPVLGFYGSDYAVIEIECPLIAWESTLGSIVNLSHHYLPDWNAGTRGIAGHNGLVIGRRWDLGAGRIVLRILVLGEPVAGYTPTLHIASKVSGTDGTVGPFTFVYEKDDPENAASYYTVGDTELTRWTSGTGARVMISEWDDTTPTTAVGTIIAFDPGLLRVTVLFDAVFAGLGASTHVLRFGTGTSLTSAWQGAYAFIADDTSKLNLGALGSGRNANVFGA